MVIIILFFCFYFEKIFSNLVKIILLINNNNSDLLPVRVRNYNFPFEERILQYKEVKYNKNKYCIFVVHPFFSNDGSNFQIRVSTNLKKITSFLSELKIKKSNIFLFSKKNLLSNELQNQGFKILNDLNFASKFFRNILLLKLALKGIKTIFICGYSLNSCVYENNIGINELMKFGFQVILIRDLTIAIEHLNSKQELAYHSAIAFLETDRISTTTSFELLDSHKEFNLKVK